MLPDPACGLRGARRPDRPRRRRGRNSLSPHAARSTGFALSLVAGSVLGLAAGVSVTASMMSRPLVTVLLGTPPIAWLVLAMLWFGAGDGTPVFTVFIASFPVIFVGALQGTRTLDNQLRTMADGVPAAAAHEAHRPLPAARRVVPVPGVDHRARHVVEGRRDGRAAWPRRTASARRWRSPARISTRRRRWPGSSPSLGALLAVEYLLLEPLKREVERWRDGAP